MLEFVAEPWTAVPKYALVWSFDSCGIWNALNGSEESRLHGLLSGLKETGVDFKRNSANISLKMTR